MFRRLLYLGSWGTSPDLGELSARSERDFLTWFLAPGGGGGRGGEEGRGGVLNNYRELGRSCITFRNLGSTVKIILGSTRKYHMGAREIWALFSGSKGALTPTSPSHPHAKGLI